MSPKRQLKGVGAPSGRRWAVKVDVPGGTTVTGYGDSKQAAVNNAGNTVAETLSVSRNDVELKVTFSE